MSEIFTYKTINTIGHGDYREKGSKFLAYAHHVEGEAEVKAITETLKKDHPKSRHVCYAYRFDLEGMQFRANDDGEPSGSAGKPILGQIDSFGVTKVLVAVVRYFGGTKLGVPGLIHAYRTSAAEALTEANIVECKVRAYYSAAFSYEKTNELMKALKKFDTKIGEQYYEDTCHLNFSVFKQDETQLTNQLEKIPDISIAYLNTQ